MKEREHRKEFMTNLRTMKPEELATREQDVSEELFWLRFKKRGGQVEKPANIKGLRRNVARLKTVAAENRARSAKEESK